MGVNVPNEISVKEEKPSIVASDIERILIRGDLSQLSEDQAIRYYESVCRYCGLNPLTRPFDFITFQGKKVLYANKGCAEQLRGLHKISIHITACEKVGDVYLVRAKAKTPDGREDESTGAVSLSVKGMDVANLYMKAETKAKRRVTLSICGLNMLDESEVEDMGGGGERKKLSPKGLPAAGVIAGEKPPVVPISKRELTDKQLKRLYAIAKASNWKREDVTEYMFKEFGKESSTELTWIEYDELCRHLQYNSKTEIEDPPEGDGFPFEK